MKKRIGALVLAAIVLFVLLGGFLFVLEHANHECADSECPVCAQMQLCMRAFQTISRMVTAVTIAFLCKVSIRSSFARSESVSAHWTLVSLKVKLSS